MNNRFLNFIENNKTREAFITTLLLASLYVLQLVVFYGVGGRDDSYITYWSAHTLSEMGEIVNYNGDRIEQSSSLLHVILLASLHKISGLPIPTLGIVFSITCGLATALLAGKLAQQMEIPFYKSIPFIIIFVPYFSYWSSSGMETSLAALCVISVLLSLRKIFFEKPSKRNFLYAGLSISLYILVRPESALVLIAYFSLLLLYAILKSDNTHKQSHATTTAYLLALTLILFLAVTTWRYFYFGQFFPQPVYAKTDILHISDRLYVGWRYLEYSLNVSTSLLVILATTTLVFLFRHKSNNAHTAIVHGFLFLLAYLLFVVFSGGDWMEGRRLLVPVIPLITILAIASINKFRVAIIGCALFFGFALIDASRFSKQESIGLPPIEAIKHAYLSGQIKPDDLKIFDYGFNQLDAFNYSHLRDMLTIPVLDDAVTKLVVQTNQPLTIASRQMGMIPYYIASKHYQKVVFIDLRGLTTKHIADCSIIVNTKPKSASGILITTRHYLENQLQTNKECAIPIADIIYDTGLISNSEAETTATLAANGYRLYYTQNNKAGNIFSQYIALNNSHGDIKQ